MISPLLLLKMNWIKIWEKRNRKREKGRAKEKERASKKEKKKEKGRKKEGRTARKQKKSTRQQQQEGGGGGEGRREETSADQGGPAPRSLAARRGCSRRRLRPPRCPLPGRGLLRRRAAGQRLAGACAIAEGAPPVPRLRGGTGGQAAGGRGPPPSPASPQTGTAGPATPRAGPGAGWCRCPPAATRPTLQ